MRQIIVCWTANRERLRILWDNDRRDSLTTIPFDSAKELHQHIKELVVELQINGHDVDIYPCAVLNPEDEFRNWAIDFKPVGYSNASVLTLT